MHELLSAALLGIVEGITEFLPISSTGHLILAGNFLQFTGEEAKTFEVVIQFAAILAVVQLYWPRFRGLLRRDPGAPFSGIRGLWLLFLTTLPAGLLGLFFYSPIKELLFAPLPVAIALTAGALGLLLVEHKRPAVRYQGLDELTWRIALGVGLFQCLSLWPGFSRAAATIMGAMFLGAGRTLAAEYSFFAAVPIVFAASAYDLYATREILAGEHLPLLATGFAVSFASAWIVIKAFLHFLHSHTLKPFAYYRLAVVALLVAFWT